MENRLNPQPNFRKYSIYWGCIGVLLALNCALFMMWRARIDRTDTAFKLLIENEEGKELLEVQELNNFRFKAWAITDTTLTEFSKTKNSIDRILKEFLKKSVAENKEEYFNTRLFIQRVTQDSLNLALRRYHEILGDIIQNDLTPLKIQLERNYEVVSKIPNQEWGTTINEIEERLNLKLDTILLSMPNTKSILKKIPLTELKRYIRFNEIVAKLEEAKTLKLDPLSKYLNHLKNISIDKGQIQVYGSSFNLDSPTRAELELICFLLYNIESEIENEFWSVRRIF